MPNLRHNPSGPNAKPSPLWFSIILGALVFGTFAPATRNDFVGYDDPVYVTGNPHIRRGINLHDLAWAFSNTETGNWHPLTWLSHMMDGALFGSHARGHHLSSVVLHTLASMALFGVLRRMTGSYWRSFFVAAAFGLHPLRAESVAWISERKDVLNGLFWILCMGAYAGYARFTAAHDVQSGDSAAREPRPGEQTWWYGCCLIFFMLSLLSKAMSVTLPFVLLLLDYWPLRRQATVARLLLEKVPFFVLSLATGVVTFLGQKSVGAIMQAGDSFAQRAANAAVSNSRYVGKVFWPADLAVFYPPVAKWPGTILIGSILGLGLVTFLAIQTRRRFPYVFVGWFWFVGTLIPVIGLIQAGEQSMADRYSYIPSIGLFLALSWGLGELVRARPLWGKWVPLVAAGSLGICMALTYRQLGFWKNTEVLFRHAIQVTRNNYLAHQNLATALEKEGRLAEAVAEFKLALEIRPNYPEAWNNLGSVMSKGGREREAMNYYREALRLNPKYPEAHNNLGLALAAQGLVAEALKEYELALGLKPDYPDAHYHRGLALGRLGRFDEALREFETTLRLEPGSADACNNLGTTLQALGRVDEAVHYYELAVRLQPELARAHYNLGVGLAAKGRWREAAAEFQRALQIQPGYSEAQKNLDTILRLQENKNGEKAR